MKALVKKSTRTRKGNKGLKSVLCQAAWAAAKTKNTRLSAYYYRLVKRRGPKKANMALAHLMVRIIYHMLSNGVSYQELGPDYLPKKEKNVDYWVQKIQQLGYKVELQELKETG
jgi:hypothetical protein